MAVVIPRARGAAAPRPGRYDAALASTNETLDSIDAPDPSTRVVAPPKPGLLVILAANRPVTAAIGLRAGSVELGRGQPLGGAELDGRLSRRHAKVRFNGKQFVVVDLGSRNGTHADGELIPAGTPQVVNKVIRAGDSLFVPVRDIGPVLRNGVLVGEASAGPRAGVEHGWVEGPALAGAMRAAANAARIGTTLHITGESGAGKEGLARAFHAAGPRPDGPFQAVNCATIPESVAERLLFGAKRGAYSGADADVEGHVQAAHGGTLFLDEVAELSLPVQAKLLRVLETSEVLRLGASRAEQVDLRFCSATHRDLRAQVAAGRLREDLFFRIASPRVAAPPLRERPEEIPWLVQAEVERAAPGFLVHATFVEACLLRLWPGNVRELLAEVRSAAQAALAAGVTLIEAKHLSDTAGTAFRDRPAARNSIEPPSRQRLTSVLSKYGGNVSAAARELGMHRTQLRRWLDRGGRNDD